MLECRENITVREYSMTCNLRLSRVVAIRGWSIDDSSAKSYTIVTVKYSWTRAKSYKTGTPIQMTWTNGSSATVESFGPHSKTETATWVPNQTVHSPQVANFRTAEIFGKVYDFLKKPSNKASLKYRPKSIVSCRGFVANSLSPLPSAGCMWIPLGRGSREPS